MILSAVLKRAGHEPEVLIAGTDSADRHTEEISRADLIGFYCVTSGDKWLKRFLEPFASRPQLVVGGPHPTFVPEVIGDIPAEFAIRGEAEGALAELMNSLGDPPEKLKSIRNLCFINEGKLHVSEQRDLIADLDGLPFQNIDPYMRYPYLKQYVQEFYPVITSRGCPHSCAYCFNKKYRELHAGKGAYTRRRSPGNVIDELLKVKHDYSVRKFIFEDDSFVVSKPWLSEFAGMYARDIRLPYICQTPAASLDPETAELLAGTGCISVRIGVETADEVNRRKILRKHVANEQIEAAAALLRRKGIMIQTFNMVGIPGEGVSEAMNTMRFNRKIKSDFTWVSFYHHYPGTDLYDEFETGNGTPPATEEVDGFFIPSTSTATDRRLVNIGMLMQFFNKTHLPEPVAKLLVSLPLTPLYRLIHKAFYALSVKKINRLGWLPFIKVSLRSNKYF